MKCRECGKKCLFGLCEECLEQKEPRASKIWQKNCELADKLGNAYYDSLLKNYDLKIISKSAKKDFGFNTFCDGIRLGMDIIMPMLDENGIKAVQQKIKAMLKLKNK